VEHDDGVAPVVRPAEELRQLGLRHLSADAGNLRRGFGQSVFAFLVLGDVEKKPRVFEIRAMLRPDVDDILQRGLFF